jgi:hypothetical protein
MMSKAQGTTSGYKVKVGNIIFLNYNAHIILLWYINSSRKN